MGISPILAVTLFELPIYRFMPTLSIIVSSISVLILIAMNLVQKSREELYPAGLSFGHGPKWYGIIPVLFGMLFFAVYFLNHISNSGDPILEFSLEAFTTALCINLFIGFLVGWQFYFGEEYGWRIYLQDRLFTILGGLKGVIVIGIIWGLWHSGLILMGMNYPGQPILGNSIMILFAIVMGVFYSIAVLKTGSVWIAVILHLITDTMEPLAWLYLSYPSDMINSFGTGIYGVAILGIIAIFLLLRLDIWEKASTLVAKRLSGQNYEHKHAHTGAKDV
ncbi:CPBP family intramembrane glutamic endopeptidase [Methanocalculus sp. MC3]